MISSAETAFGMDAYCVRDVCLVLSDRFCTAVSLEVGQIDQSLTVRSCRSCQSSRCRACAALVAFSDAASLITR